MCIKDECFYIISNDGSTVTMLAKYNLYVGQECTGLILSLQCIPYGDEATGIQDSSMGINQGDLRSGVTAFSNINNDYSGSIIEGYVNSYNSYLITQGVMPIEARLISYDELITLGCEKYAYCSDQTPEWVYSTSYWSMSGDSEFPGSILYMDGASYCDSYPPDCSDSYGVRPVIEISVDEIAIIRTESGDLDTVGSEICISDECFYVISSTTDTVTMLAKYNLYVGGSINQSTLVWTAYGEEATGMQAENMRGIVSGENISNGTTKFSSDAQKGTNYSDYNGSIVEGYVNTYKSKLEEKFGVEVKEARLMILDELTKFGCSTSALVCRGSPAWIQSTSYWSGTASKPTNIWGVNSKGYFTDYGYGYNHIGGVRPVITISKSEF